MIGHQAFTVPPGEPAKSAADVRSTQPVRGRCVSLQRLREPCRVQGRGGRHVGCCPPRMAESAIAQLATHSPTRRGLAGQREPPRSGGVDGTLAELLDRLGTTPTGLSSGQARGRQRGPDAPARTRWRRLVRVLEVLRGIANPLTAVLAVAGIASAVLGQPVQASLIGAMIVRDRQPARCGDPRRCARRQ